MTSSCCRLNDAERFMKSVDNNDEVEFEDLLNGLQRVANEDTVTWLSLSVFDNKPLIHYVCSKKDLSQEFIIKLLQTGVSVNLRSKQELRPLHEACLHNCPTTVRVLLDHGAKIVEEKKTLWEKQSPFYIASTRGYSEVLEELIQANPMCVKYDGVRNHLLYAACLDGNLDIVKIWYNQGADINYGWTVFDIKDPVNECEGDTPLFAACAGGHYEVAKYLFKMGAVMSKRVCEKYPDITGRILLENNTKVLDFSKQHLEAVHHDWLQNGTFTLVCLDLSTNNIERLPQSIPWSFHSLEYFNVRDNVLTSLKPPVDNNIKCNKLKEMLLRNNRLTEVCGEVFQLPALEILDLSNNQLEDQFDRMFLQETSTVVENSPKLSEWTCKNLSRLDLSHNQLMTLPMDIKSCVGMKKLNASHNKLVNFPGGWNCKLVHLDLSHNELLTFGDDIHLNWSGSLSEINLDHNKLQSLRNGIVKLCKLTNLAASNNIINELPEPKEWDCKQLYTLNLKDNCLGNSKNKTTQVTPTKISKLPFGMNKNLPYASESIILPDFLKHCLHELNLSHNQLDCVPKGICHLSSLVLLDLSGNSGISELPKEMGNLTSLSYLEIDGLKLSGLPKDLPTDNERSREIITSLSHELRKSKTYNKLKLVILGKKDKGKTTIAGLLQGSNRNSSFGGSGINKFELTISQNKKLNFLKKAQDITFSVWDMDSTEQYVAVQHCFFTKNSLYLVIWDVWSLEKELDQVGKLLYSIEAQTPRSNVIIVATFLDKKVTNARKTVVDEIITKVVDRYGGSESHWCCRLKRENIIPVSCTTKEGIQNLKQRICQVATEIPDSLKNNKKTFLSRKIPQSYFEVEKAIASKLESKKAENDPPFMVKKEFIKLIREIPECDIDTPTEIEKVTQFLVESGSLLHFSDQLKGLNNLYFMDPSWLGELLTKVFAEGVITGGKIEAKELKTLYEDDSRFPSKHLDEYIQLLERSEIALSVNSGKKFFIPALLPENPGMELHGEEKSGKSVCRLYKMLFVPLGFWNHLLSRIMVCIEPLECRDSWSASRRSSIPLNTIDGRDYSGSRNGLNIRRKNMVYWRDGMCVSYSDGYFKLESVNDHGKPPVNGILVVVHSYTEQFSVMGIIVDEIEDLLLDHFPNLLALDMCSQRFALCSQCYCCTTLNDFNGIDHFNVESCARYILCSNTISCKQGVSTNLNHLVPELLMNELPTGYYLDKEMLKVDKKNALGSGKSGTVYKGRYGDTDVAVKYYYDSQKDSPITGIDKNDGGDKEKEREADLHKGDYSTSEDQARSYSVWKSYREMRQEVAFSSKLRHPCIIDFVGICVQEDLLMCLEFAPLGSLRNVLNDKMKERKACNKYRDRNQKFDIIFGKELTYKLVLQVAHGLEYLHKNNIIHRDLKSDNILITTLDISALVNLKLTDYGISKFYHSGGNSGRGGTKGYMAPEVMEELNFDSKVDIFSFAMVIYEILSGRRPFSEFSSEGQIRKAMKIDSKRPNLKRIYLLTGIARIGIYFTATKECSSSPDISTNNVFIDEDFNIVTKFPSIESLMKKSWDDLGTKRPSASEIIELMKRVEFICRSVTFSQIHENIGCICPVAEGPGFVWIWEDRDEKRQYHIIDLSECAYHLYGQSLPGDTVTCMCQVDKEIWIGTENSDEGGMIEIYDQQEIGVLKFQHSISTNGLPTSITNVSSCGMDKKVFVTLSNGKLCIFTPVPQLGKDNPPPVPPRTYASRKSTVTKAPEQTFTKWRLNKCQQVAPDKATCLEYTPKQNEVWIGCGNQLIIYSNSRLLVEHRFHIEHIMNNPEIGDKWSVQTVKYSVDKVWCLLQNTTVFLEFDVESRTPLNIYDCDERSPKGMVISRNYSVEVHIAKKTNEYDAETLSDAPPLFAETDQTPNPTSKFYDSCQMQVPPLPQMRKKLTKKMNTDTDTKRHGVFIESRKAITSTIGITEEPTEAPNLRRARSKERRSNNQCRNKDSGYYSSTCSDRQSCGSVYLNSITVVGNTLWASRNINDIMVINIGSCNFKKGEVMTVLDCNGQNKEMDIEGIGMLIHIPGHPVVVSVMNDKLMTSRLQCWEALDADDIGNIRTYWNIERNKKKYPELTIADLESSEF